jgi:hypothetical protein
MQITLLTTIVFPSGQEYVCYRFPQHQNPKPMIPNPINANRKPDSKHKPTSNPNPKEMSAYPQT